MRYFLLLFMFLNFALSKGQLVDWLVSASNSHELYDMAADTIGNVYVVGATNAGWNSYGLADSVRFNGTSYASPHIPSNWSQAFIAKLDSNGNLVWCKMMGEVNRIGYHGTPRSYIVEVDSKNDVIIDIEFGDSLIIENDTVLHSTIAINGLYKKTKGLIKMDESGVVIWVRLFSHRFKSNNGTFMQSTLLVDGADNIYINPSNEKTPSYPTYPSVIYKYDKNGTLVRSFPQPAISDFTVDQYQRVYAGWTRADTFIVVYDSSGLIQNAVRSSKGKPLIRKLEIDKYGNAFAFGHADSIMMEIGGKPLMSKYSGELTFLLRMNPNYQIDWLHEVGVDLYDFKGDMALTNDGVIISGIYYGWFAFNNFDHRLSQGGFQKTAYISKISTSGHVNWLKSVTATTQIVNTLLETGLKNSIYASFESGVSGYGGPLDTLEVDGHKAPWGRGRILKLLDGTNEISGRIYVDSNNNLSPDQTDLFLYDQVVTLNNKHHLVTNRYGEYNIFVPPGSYTIDYVNPPKYSYLSPTSHTATFNNVQQRDTTNHFIVKQYPGVNDVRVVITPRRSRASLRNSGTAVYLACKNIGTTLNVDTVVLEFDSSLLAFDSSTLSPVKNGNKLQWVISGMKPMTNWTNRVNFLYANAAMGDTLKYKAFIAPIQIDTFPLDNVDSATQLVVASYDPNDKQVSPIGNVLPEFVHDGNFFTYTIRFQNTGNDTALTVRLRDSISENLDLNTFEVLSSSHDYEIICTDEDVLDFVFNDIYLPDSNVNEPLSHGFIKYRIKGYKSLDHGDFIDNTAYIYFDNNDAVVTNTTHTEIVIWAGTISEEDRDAKIWIYPNPTYDDFVIVIGDIDNPNCNLRIMDLSGRIIYYYDDLLIDGNEIKMTGLNLNSGLYIIELTSNNFRRTTKLLVQ